MKKPVKIVIFSVTLVIIVAVMGNTLLAPAKAQVMVAAPGTIAQNFTEAGKIIAVNDYQLSAGVGEVVVEDLPVLEGQRVKKGQLLATLAPGPLRNYLESQSQQLAAQRKALTAQRTMSVAERTVAVEQARAQFESAQWQYESLFNQDFGAADSITDNAVENMLQARYTWQEIKDGSDDMAANRAHSLYRQAIDSMKIAQVQYSPEAKVYYESLMKSSQKMLAALEGSQAAVDSINAAIEELDISSKLLEQKLSITEICAPFDGIVHTVMVEPGQPVSNASPILSIASEKELEVETYLLASDVMNLKVGDSAVCRLGSGESFTCTVSFVAAGAQERVSTVGITENRCLVRLHPDNLAAGVSTGFGVDVDFSVIKADNVFSVPLSAVSADKNGVYGVYLLMDGRARFTPVTIGIIGSGYVEIKEGLAQGDTVILLSNELELRDGKRVSPQP